MRIIRALRHSLMAGFFLTLGGKAVALPIAEAPGLKPDLMVASEVLSTRDAGMFRTGLQHVDQNNWPGVQQIETRLQDETARNILTWYRARRDPDMSFEDIDQALQNFADWPERSQIWAQAERAITTSGLSPSQRVDWFRTQGGARSGAGYLAYAEALEASGEKEAAHAQIRLMWHGASLSEALSQKAYSRYKTELSLSDHQKRADFLLWTRQTSAAARLKPLLGQGWQRLIDARSGLIRRARNVDAAVRAVPPELSSSPGLLFDRAVWRRRARMTDRVAPLLREIDGLDVPPAGRIRLWKEKNIQLRAALKARDWSLAYALAAPHGLSRGSVFAEAEWMAGLIALRHLGQADRALQHFLRLEQGVGTPISLSRAKYWQGRAYQALNQSDEARKAFAEGAAYSFTYYGQLAAEHVDNQIIQLKGEVQVTQADRTQFHARPQVRAMRLFAENGWESAFRKFAYHLDDQFTRAVDYELLAEFGRAYHYADIGVRGAKAGLAQGIVAPEAAYPVVTYPLLREPEVERSLMLALARQESEMNPAARSHANARGLMQFIPRTAKLEATKRGRPFRTSWLTDDPGYNMTLGGAHLDSLLGEFNGSYIMTAAAYNAGAARPKRWIGEYGDPRAGEIDPVDWVEFIPFSETRNYVQRVLENTQVYRHRLSGQPEPIQLSDDLERGRF